ncbi:MAG: transporter substrate-binding domain-containing protein [Oceanospirillaceae bacterium]|nr:transporter substrate-binding domain-containing protein [Oceanospirillaceae bacterium]MCP5350948.1 transporter substrate-binding domain-containing protein [Oceanospirillaceae bacterium]
MRVWLAFSLLCLAAISHAQTLTLYTYHEAEPFINEGQVGLSQHFVEHFNALNKNGLQLRLQPIQRPALNRKIAANDGVLLLWANALWFKKLNDQVTVSDVLFWDSDMLVSLAEKPLEYTGPQSLSGKTFTAPAGHVYYELDDLITAGKIKRISMPDYFSMLAELLSGKADAMMLTHSTLLFWQKNRPDVPPLYSSKQHYDEYSRHILATPPMAGYLPEINRVIAAMRHDQAWQQLLEQYGIFTLLDPFNLDIQELQKVQQSNL